MNDSYQPIGAVFKSTLPRILLQAGLIPPDMYPSDATTTTPLTKAGSGIVLPGNNDPYPESIKDRIMSSLGSLQPRPGMVEAFTTTYRDETLVPSHIDQVELWGATNGGLQLGEKLFKGALGDQVDIFIGSGASDKQRVQGSNGKGLALFSCDEIKIAKPDPKVYQTIKSRIESEGKGSSDLSLWFVASHTWDLFAAKRAGFKTAWVGYEEFHTCPDIYQRPDIIASNLKEAAMMILAHEGNNEKK
jgi:platelet-activating factor acetylhydrolase